MRSELTHERETYLAGDAAAVAAHIDENSVFTETLASDAVSFVRRSRRKDSNSA